MSEPILTERLQLRPLAHTDLPVLWRLHSDPRAFEHDAIPELGAVDQMQRVLAQWLAHARRDHYGYFLVTTHDGEPVGAAGLSGMDVAGDTVANLYVRLFPDQWRQGYALEALRAVLAAADRSRSLDPDTPYPSDAVVITAVQNTPMRRLAEQLGFHETDEEDPTAGFEHVLLRRPVGLAAPADRPAPAGRFAPSPSGDFHLGNLRTGILAWFFARATHRRFVMRVEDLDRVRPGAEQRQLEDLRAVGIEWDEPLVRQSERTGLYNEAARRLAERGLVYECYCTRREIQEAPSAPHAAPGAYPGTCRDLTEAEREAGRAKVADLNREPALRLRADVSTYRVRDRFAGVVEGAVDDIVLRRGDGVWAYNLVSVVDDCAFAVDQIVRADDLLASAPRQAHLTALLQEVWPSLWGRDVPGWEGAARSGRTADGGSSAGGGKAADGAAPWPEVEYIHVPLALNTNGQRLAKRDGAVTLRDRLDAGESIADVVDRIGRSLGVEHAHSAADIAAALDPSAGPGTEWVLEPWVVDLPATPPGA